MTRRHFLEAASVAASAAAATPGPYQVGAYYFPNFHVDPRNEEAHGPGWTEWELVKHARPRFPGHVQPKVPLWGYEDESTPAAFARKIDAAADHGISHFIFDWYWYNGRPYLEKCLNEGYLKAANRSRLKFCLMWANHDWVDIHPAKLSGSPKLLYPGRVTREVFEVMTDHIVADYFRNPCYWRVDGRPYFSIYELFKLVEGFGGVQQTREALDSFRRKATAAGLPGVHLNAVLWGVKILPGETAVASPKELLSALGFDSTTSYVCVHHVKLTRFPESAYDTVSREMAAHWEKAGPAVGLSYHPNVTMGWDPSPRTVQTDRLVNAGYPFMATLKGNTPAAFERALRSMKAFLDRDPKQPKICNLNAWNEWTEGSYLEPDVNNRMAYLEAIRRVFSA